MINSIHSTELNGVIMEVVRVNSTLEFGPIINEEFKAYGYMPIDFDLSVIDNCELLDESLEHFEQEIELINNLVLV